MGRLSDPRFDQIFDTLPFGRCEKQELRDRPGPCPSASSLLARLEQLVAEELRLQRIAERKCSKAEDVVRLHQLTLEGDSFGFEVCWFSPAGVGAVVPGSDFDQPPRSLKPSSPEGEHPAPYRDRWEWGELLDAVAGLEALLLPAGAPRVAPRELKASAV